MDAEEWERARGASCPRCQREVYQLLLGKRGLLCPLCLALETDADLEKQAEKQMQRRATRLLREGRLSLRDLREGRI